MKATRDLKKINLRNILKKSKVIRAYCNNKIKLDTFLNAPERLYHLTVQQNNTPVGKKKNEACLDKRVREQ